MSDPGIQGIDHVDVTTPEELEDEVLAFYRDGLGLQPREKPAHLGEEKGAWFVAGAQEVHISIDPHNPPQRAHFGLVVDDFEAAVARLREAGVHLEQAPSIPGTHRLYTRDPAGNRIEISAIDEAPAAVRTEEG
jgi:catechol 2,3-dioxygenase-like lactoylglutathione lyase family enzyme